MKNNKIRRFLALVLAASMILSDVSLAAFADTEQVHFCGMEEHTHAEGCYDPEGAILCQLPEHTHIQECYVNPVEETTEETEATEDTDPTEESEAAGDTESTEETEATEAADETEATEETKETEATDETEAAEESLYVQLLAAVTLKDIFDLMMSDPEAVYALTTEELAQIKAHAEEVHAAIEAPTADDEEYYALILDTLEMLLDDEEQEDAPVALEEPAKDTIYFDLSLGDVVINASSYSGFVYQKDADGNFIDVDNDSSPDVIAVSGNHNADYSYYVFQSTPTETGYVTVNADNIVTAVAKPEISQIDGWANTITKNRNVSTVISQWEEQAQKGGVGRTSTNHKITVTGNSTYNVVIDDIWSSYVDSAGTSRKTGGVSFFPTSNGQMTLTFIGDNRLQNIPYSASNPFNSSNQSGNKLTLKGSSNSDTLTVASNDRKNTHNSVIGGADHSGKPACTIEIVSGILYAGAQSSENCAAIGGGGNGDADIRITGGTVTAVTASNGAAIGGGYGGSGVGGKGTVTITGGTVYAYNLSNSNNNGIGTAIGGGSSRDSTGGEGIVTISGNAVVHAETDHKGVAIGGGNSKSSSASKGTVNLLGGSVTAINTGTFQIGGGCGKTVDAGSLIQTTPAATLNSIKLQGNYIVEYKDGDTTLYTYTSTSSEVPILKEHTKTGYYFITWVDEKQNSVTKETTLQEGTQTFTIKWGAIPFTDTVYFDLALGDVTINNSAYSGYIYDQVNKRTVFLNGSHNDSLKYYVYQSVDTKSTGINGSGVTLPDPVALVLPEGFSSWAQVITNNDDVADVITQWENSCQPQNADRTKFTRPFTNYHVYMTGSGKYDLTIDNIWSKYIQASESRTHGSVGLNAASVGQLTLRFKGDNRLESLHYNGGNTNNRLELIGESNATLTVAATIDGKNHWNSAIGASDSLQNSYNIILTNGTIFAGSRILDNCTAIGAGGNGYSNVIIDGGTITAVVSSSGTAIGGGIGYNNVGGDTEVTINNGTVYAYNHGNYLGSSTEVAVGSQESTVVPATAIGGGSSIKANGNQSTTVTINKGFVFAKSIHGAAIGGGGSATGEGGDATININGGKVIAISAAGDVYGYYKENNNSNSQLISQYHEAGVSIGGGTGFQSGGNATINITGTPTIFTGSMGGGDGTDKDAPLGFAQVTINGGQIQGQVIMQATTGNDQHCTFTMSDGTINNNNKTGSFTQSYNGVPYEFTFLQPNGGALCMLDPQGETTITGGTIEDCSAVNGGAVYMTAGTFIMADGTVNGTPTSPTIQNCSAAESGGAVYLGGGNVTMSGGTITNNTASIDGGGIAVNNGSFDMSGGTIQSCSATENGGGIAVDGGDVTILDGTITGNTAEVSGGGIAVNNGQIVMAGGTVSDNTANDGHGGGMYVSSSNAEQVAVKLFSGKVTGNKAPSGSGGAVAVEGSETGEIFVQIGLNLKHEFNGDTLNSIPHDHDGNKDNNTPPEFTHIYCPVIQRNSSQVSGGGFYITGGSNTLLNIYCLREADNKTTEDADYLGNVLSKFMMVEGGKVLISSSETNSDGSIDKETSGFGSTSIVSSVHVYAGELYLYGNMDNPAFIDAITVDHRNTTDKFEDNRISDDKIKLSYHENFHNPDGTQDSTQKAYDIKESDVETIADLMFNHPGYTIKAWNTDPNGNGINYTVGDKYLFVKEGNPNNLTPSEGQKLQEGNLNLYAIWEANGFWVEFHPNVPDGEQYSGTMDKQDFVYDQPETLNKNQFLYPGHVFTQWTYTKDDGTIGTLTDGQENVSNLTEIRGNTVHLYANWEICNHPTEYIVYSTEGAVLTKTCTQCGQSASVTIQAEDAVYDHQVHKYTVSYTDQTFFSPVINCTNHKHDSQDPVDAEWEFINAGVYTVTTQEFTNPDSTTVQASLTYTIAKAEQPKPLSRPEYEVPEAGNFNLIINEEAGERYSPISGSQIYYNVKYIENGEEQELGWKCSDENGNVSFQLDKPLTTYSVYSYYPATDNYLKSDEQTAVSSFFFAGSLIIEFFPTTGVTFNDPLEKEECLELEPRLEDGFYLPNGNFQIKVLSGNTSGYIKINDFDCKDDNTLVSENTDHKFQITAVNSNKPEEGKIVTIQLEVGYATKKTIIESKITENQVFGNVRDSSATISRDSAYTAYFEVKDYDIEVYENPSLSFSNSLPSGTRIILQNKADNSYWSYLVSNDTSSVLLTEFIRMGTESEKFQLPDYDLWRLQFVVDFSQVQDTNLLTDGTVLNTQLSFQKQANAPGTAPDLTTSNNNPGVTATLNNTGFSLKNGYASGLTQELTCSFTEGIEASKWDNRDLALLVIPKDALPADAAITAEVNGNKVKYRPVQFQKDSTSELTTAFLIAIGAHSGNISLRLESDIFPDFGSYSMDVQLVAAQSIAEDAPINGTVVGSDTITFSISEQTLSLKVYENSGKHLFTQADTMELIIQFLPKTLPSAYTLKADVERESDGKYVFFGVSYEPYLTDSSNSTGQKTLTTQISLDPGNYRIRVYIDYLGYAILETSYYFIVQKSS